MSYLILPSRRARQPSGYVRVSSSYAYAKNLRGAWLASQSTPLQNASLLRGIGALTAVGSPSLVATTYGMGMLLNGSSQYLTNTSNSAVTNIPATFFGFFRRDSSPPSARVFDISTGTTANDVIGLQVASGPTYRAQHYDGGTDSYAASSVTPAVGQWFSIAGRFAGLSDRQIFINGVQTGTGSSTVVSPSGINRVTIGFAPWGSEYWPGAVAVPLLFDVALPDAEIADLHAYPWKWAAPDPRRIYFGAGAGGGAVTGTASITQSPQTVTSSGLVAVGGTLNKTPSAQTTTASGAVAVGGTLNKTPSAQTLTASGTVVSGVVGAANITPASQTATATSMVAVAATASVTPAAQTLTSSGAVTGGTVTGAASITPAAQTLTGSATVSGGAVTGTASITPSAQTVIAAGNIIVLATANITPAAQTVTASEEGLLPEDVPDTSKYIDSNSPRIGVAPNIKRRGDPTHGTGKITRPRLG